MVETKNVTTTSLAMQKNTSPINSASNIETYLSSGGFLRTKFSDKYRCIAHILNQNVFKRIALDLFSAVYKKPV